MGFFVFSSTFRAFNFKSSPSFFRPRSSVVSLSISNPQNPNPKPSSYSLVLNPFVVFHTIRGLASRGFEFKEEFNGGYYQNGALGGMPSSHTTLCMTLMTFMVLCHGVADSFFPVCVRCAGMQVEVLVGAVLGIMIVCIYCQGCLVAT
ncbi:hypothetical protein PVL29_015963 [Vitis rotundifolia]|uniref:Uncharacterized protein n=1 Tax=Vitis rotundifolia TaxID=103349 RepID=A0AA38ZE07_VITRO|nr:hypothetical protein PVL29_015963 [Vitis rotundifolia]